MAQFDLTRRISKFVNKHVTLSLLEHLKETAIYDKAKLDETYLKTLEETNMVDAIQDEYERRGFSEEKIAGLQKRKEQLLEKARELELKCSAALDAIEEVEKTGFDDPFSKIDEKQIENLFDYVMFQYSCGKYDAVPHMLRKYYIPNSKNAERKHEARWGILVAQIQMGELDAALDHSLPELRNAIQEREKEHLYESELHQMYERAALLHYSLFIYFAKDCFDKMISNTGLFKEQRFQEAISTVCPHLLRYMVMAVILLNDTQDDNKKQLRELKDIADIIQEESSSYRDCLPEFLRLLWIDNDFDGAAKCFQECQKVIHNDFFLSYYLEVFNDAARVITLKQYCKLYSRIRISELCKYLGFDDEEKCMGFVTRKVQEEEALTARLDVEERVVYINYDQFTPYQQLLMKTTSLNNRSQDLFKDLRRKLQSRR